MARPRTHGPSITLRLKLDRYAELERRAAAKGETPRAYLLRNLEAQLAPVDAGATVVAAAAALTRAQHGHPGSGAAGGSAGARPATKEATRGSV